MLCTYVWAEGSDEFTTAAVGDTTLDQSQGQVADLLLIKTFCSNVLIKRGQKLGQQHQLRKSLIPGNLKRRLDAGVFDIQLSGGKSIDAIDPAPTGVNKKTARVR
jgi:hypothetical protein